MLTNVNFFSWHMWNVKLMTSNVPWHCVNFLVSIFFCQFSETCLKLTCSSNIEILLMVCIARNSMVIDAQVSKCLGCKHNIRMSIFECQFLKYRSILTNLKISIIDIKIRCFKTWCWENPCDNICCKPVRTSFYIYITMSSPLKMNISIHSCSSQQKPFTHIMSTFWVSI